VIHEVHRDVIHEINKPIIHEMHRNIIEESRQPSHVVTSQAAPIIEQDLSKMAYIEKLPPAPTTVIQESVVPMTTAAITTTSVV
jgi:hypothetical protein